jgi:hypothetical protein
VNRPYLACASPTRFRKASAWQAGRRLQGRLQKQRRAPQFPAKPSYWEVLCFRDYGVIGKLKFPQDWLCTKFLLLFALSKAFFRHS